VKVYFDEEADALMISLGGAKIIESEEVQPGVILDFDENNEVVGIELLRVSQRVPLAELKRMQFEVA
jgi:uncharacterized protein YuzE